MQATELKSRFDAAEELAREHGFPTFLQWCDNLQLQYDFMPKWYWNHEERMKRYISATSHLNNITLQGQGMARLAQITGIS